MIAKVIEGDALTVLRTLADKSIQCCVTSPPYYGLRDYGTAKWIGGDPTCDHKHLRKKTTRGGPHSTLSGGQNLEMHQGQYRGTCEKCGALRIDEQIGLEDTPALYIAKLVEVYREVKRVLRDDGVVWIVIGDSYASTWSCGRRNAVGQGACDYGSRQTRTGEGIKEKDLIGIPWMLAFALRDDGWYLRSEIIWEKPSCMPESTKDRPTRSHEQVFLLSKSDRYFYDSEAIKEPLAEGSIKRLSQPNLANQNGSDRAHAGVKTNGPMKPVVKRSGNKERKFRSENGGNPDSNSGMGYAIPWEDDGGGRNKRTVWKIEEELFAQFLRWMEEYANDNPHSVVTVASKPFKDAHFATYPPDLIEPMILAGSSERACEVCGAPWERETELIERKTNGGSLGVPREDRGVFADLQGTSQSDREGLTQSSYRTIGFAPTCKCENAGSARSVVLDPFCGSGTTGLVCSRLERDFIGIDLKPAYAKMSRRRIKDDAPLFDVLGEHT